MCSFHLFRSQTAATLYRLPIIDQSIDLDFLGYVIGSTFIWCMCYQLIFQIRFQFIGIIDTFGAGWPCRVVSWAAAGSTSTRFGCCFKSQLLQLCWGSSGGRPEAHGSQGSVHSGGVDSAIVSPLSGLLALRLSLMRSISSLDKFFLFSVVACFWCCIWEILKKVSVVSTAWLAHFVSHKFKLVLYHIK